MDELVYNALCRYFNALEKTGYMAYSNVLKLLVLIFYKDFVYSDYRCTITKDDYRLIEKALDCLYGTTCLIPYPDYLKMGKLHLSEVTELACRLKALENEKVVKVIHDLTGIEDDGKSDIMVVVADDDEVTPPNLHPENNAEGEVITDDPTQHLNPGTHEGGTVNSNPFSRT